MDGFEDDNYLRGFELWADEATQTTDVAIRVLCSQSCVSKDTTRSSRCFLTRAPIPQGVDRGQLIA